MWNVLECRNECCSRVQHEIYHMDDTGWSVIADQQPLRSIGASAYHSKRTMYVPIMIYTLPSRICINIIITCKYIENASSVSFTSQLIKKNFGNYRHMYKTVIRVSSMGMRFTNRKSVGQNIILETHFKTPRYREIVVYSELCIIIMMCDSEVLKILSLISSSSRLSLP